MYTKTVIERLSEKLAEELDSKQLEELTKLCDGIYNPALLEVPRNYRGIVACGASYYNSEHCNSDPSSFNSDLCMDEGRFDWGSCEKDAGFSNGVIPGPVCQHPFSCVSYSCPGNDEFTCSGSTAAEDPFNCSQDFECPTHVTCYAGFSCGGFDCENFHGCAGGYDCNDSFECEANTGFMCGEGVQAGTPLEQFNCTDGENSFTCGHESGSSAEGTFHCRECHACSGSFTCYYENSCGTSNAQDKFSCGSEATMPPSGEFYCARIQLASATQCLMPHNT